MGKVVDLECPTYYIQLLILTINSHDGYSSLAFSYKYLFIYLFVCLIVLFVCFIIIYLFVICVFCVFSFPYYFVY